MSKDNIVRSPTTPDQFHNKQSAKAELAVFRAAVSGLMKNPEELREVTVKAGISTPTGKLKKAYRG